MWLLLTGGDDWEENQGHKKWCGNPAEHFVFPKWDSRQREASQAAEWSKSLTADKEQVFFIDILVLWALKLYDSCKSQSTRGNAICDNRYWDKLTFFETIVREGPLYFWRAGGGLGNVLEHDFFAPPDCAWFLFFGGQWLVQEFFNSKDSTWIVQSTCSIWIFRAASLARIISSAAFAVQEEFCFENCAAPLPLPLPLLLPLPLPLPVRDVPFPIVNWLFKGKR